MPRRTLLTILLAGLCGSSIAADIVTDMGHDGHVDRIVISQAEHGGLVEIHEGQQLVGKFTNLIVNEGSLASDIVPMLGGGIAIYADSYASRSKYHIVAPIDKTGNRLHIRCIYKSVYDSTYEEKLVGASCQDVDLADFDINKAIGDEGLFRYEETPSWLKKLPLDGCANPAGFTYGDSYIVNCSEDASRVAGKSRVIAFTSSGEIMFSIDGYEFFPRKGSEEFSLGSDLDDKVIHFSGSLACLKTPASTPALPTSKAVMGGKFDIRYSIKEENGCYTGAYLYATKGIAIDLAGRVGSGVRYLMEYDKNRKVSGLFILDKADSALSGTWIGAPARKPLSVH